MRDHKNFYTNEPCLPNDLNEVLEPWCWDAQVEIAWDQWARVRVFCIHGTSEGVSGGLCLNEAWGKAMESWRSMDHSPHRCYADLPAPQSYMDRDDKFWTEHGVECELFRGHEGDHHYFEDDDGADEYAYLYGRMKYFKNGHDRTGTAVFGSTIIPHPYRKYLKEVG